MKKNAPESPSAESSAERNPCYETLEKHVFALGASADDGQVYFFATAQFLDADLAANPEVQNSENAPPERLRVRYATGEVVIIGRGLRRLAKMLQGGELANITACGQRYTWLHQSGLMISSITVTRKEVA